MKSNQLLTAVKETTNNLTSPISFNENISLDEHKFNSNSNFFIKILAFLNCKFLRREVWTVRLTKKLSYTLLL